MEFSMYKLFGLRSCFKRTVRCIDRWLDALLWRIGEILKLYLVGIGCLMDELPLKFSRVVPIKLFFDKKQANSKVAVVTGGATGIGLHVCKGLCMFGVRVIIVGNNEGRALKAVEEIKAEYPTSDVQFMYCDLASFKSIKTFASKYKERGLPLHILVNNAGVMLCPHWTTTDGFEEHFGVNYMGHVYLTNLLMDVIKASGLPNEYARIVNVSSEAYSMGTLQLRDLNSRHRYSPHFAYMQSKLAMLMWTFKLQRELMKEAYCHVTVNALHPGVVNTDLYKHTNIVCRIGKYLGGRLLKRPWDGAYVCCYVALSKELEGLGGKYIRERYCVPTTTESQDQAKQEQLWTVTHRLIESVEAGKPIM